MNLYIDEAGSITQNNGNRNRFFIIACIETSNPYHVIRQFRKAKSQYIKEHPESQLDIKKEIKGSEMPFGMKKMIFNRIKDKTDAVFHFKVIDNKNLYPNLRNQGSLSFNYFVGRMVKKIHKINNLPNESDLFMLIDDRNQSVGSLNSLEEYLKIEFTLKTNVFKCLKTKYKDSSTKDLVQLADIFANTVFRVCRGHAYNQYDKRNRELINCCRVGMRSYFPYKSCELDICN